MGLKNTPQPLTKYLLKNCQTLMNIKDLNISEYKMTNIALQSSWKKSTKPSLRKWFSMHSNKNLTKKLSFS